MMSVVETLFASMPVYKVKHDLRVFDKSSTALTAIGSRDCSSHSRLLPMSFGVNIGDALSFLDCCIAMQGIF